MILKIHDGSGYYIKLDLQLCCRAAFLNISKWKCLLVTGWASK